MKIEIGSNFWLAPEDYSQNHGEVGSPEQFGCKGSDFVWLSTGRSAISLVIKNIEERKSYVNKVVCLPAFTCNTVYEPFMNAGYDIVTIPVDKYLKTSGEDVLAVVGQVNASIVLFHHYFGFDTLPGINKAVTLLREKGVVVIEDCTQSLYSSIPRINADYFVGSIRKWCGAPDGGFAVCKEGVFANKPHEYDRELEYMKYRASTLKYDYVIHEKGCKDEFLSIYREAEELLSSRACFYAIGELSKKVQCLLDVEWMKKKRRSNFEVLLKELSDVEGVIPLFDDLGEGVVPLYFPILCEVRKNIQDVLVKNAIYAPIIWPKENNCPEVNADADYLYNHLLCLPIDQRYDLDDMNRIVSVIRNI